MRHCNRWTAALTTGPERKAPSEFRIWQAGENMTDFGPSLFTDRSAREVTAEYRRRGNKLSMDYEHLSVPENRKSDEPWEGAGYFEIEVRQSATGPELWAIRIEWADEARRQIEQGERRYFSPDYFQDDKTNEIVRLNKIALCTDPATHRLNLLASKSGRKTRTAVDEENGDNKTAVEGGEDSKSKLMALLLALRDKVDDEAIKSQIDEGILLLAKDDDAPAMPAAAATVVEPQQQEPKPGQAARVAAAPRVDLATDLRIVAIERRLDGAETARLIQANRDLLPETQPALELWAMKQRPDNLVAWIKAQRTSRPKPAPGGGNKPQQRKQLAAATAETDAAGTFDPEAVQLTATDRAVLKRTGGDPAKYLTHKRQLAAKRAGVDWTPAKASH